MTIASEITRLQGAKADIRQAIIDKGVDVCADLTIDNYACCIASIPTGAGDTFVDFLLIGGGGGGGAGPYGGGGGGAGGIMICQSEPIQSLNFITIGSGGNGGCDEHTGGNGGNSTFVTKGGIHTVIGGGGGGGSTYCNCPAILNGCAGGSGGGGGRPYNYSWQSLGGAGTEGQGYKGGDSCACSFCSTAGGSGGGGGAGGEGNCGYFSYAYVYSGNGGCGICSDIEGTTKCYAGGGGGGGGSVRGQGCDGGGDGYGCAGTTCGSGGGGNNSAQGGAGAGGLLIVKYPTACGYDITGGCKYTCGDYTIHCFTSNGTLTVN